MPISPRLELGDAHRSRRFAASGCTRRSPGACTVSTPCGFLQCGEGVLGTEDRGARRPSGGARRSGRGSANLIGLSQVQRRPRRRGWSKRWRRRLRSRIPRLRRNAGGCGYHRSAKKAERRPVAELLQGERSLRAAIGQALVAR
jgi:hypothetical protein